MSVSHRVCVTSLGEICRGTPLPSTTSSDPPPPRGPKPAVPARRTPDCDAGSSGDRGIRPRGSIRTGLLAEGRPRPSGGVSRGEGGGGQYRLERCPPLPSSACAYRASHPPPSPAPAAEEELESCSRRASRNASGRVRRYPVAFLRRRRTHPDAANDVHGTRDGREVGGSIYSQNSPIIPPWESSRTTIVGDDDPPTPEEWGEGY